MTEIKRAAIDFHRDAAWRDSAPRGSFSLVSVLSIGGCDVNVSAVVRWR